MAAPSLSPTLARGPQAPPARAGRIGPNAILQLVPVLERVGGRELRDRLFAAAGIWHLPVAEGLIDEAPVARLHQEMRRQVPDLAPVIAWEAGTRTGDYILAHRIPALAQRVLKVLPPGLARPVLVTAIEQHAWTFAGSGRFEVVSRRPLVFAIHDNPVVRGERSDHPLCHWHAAVFERLFRVLVHPGTVVRETACAATGAPCCRFEVALA